MSVGGLQFRLHGIELLAGLLEHLERHHLGMFQGAAIVAIGVEDRALPLDLVLGLLGDRQVGLADLVEAVADIAARDLHPHVGAALEDIDLAVGDLIHQALGVVADGVEAVGDRLIALADLHFGGLLAHHLVEDFRLPQRARDQRDLVLVEVGYLLEQGVDGGRLDLVRHQSHFAQGR